METVIQYNGATVTVRRGTVRTRLQQSLLYNKLDISERMTDEDFLFISYYVRLLTQVSVKGNLGIDIPKTTDDPAQLKAGLSAFLDADVEFYDVVIAALNEIDSTMNEPELSPESDPNG